MGAGPAGRVNPGGTHRLRKLAAQTWVPWQTRAFWATQALVGATLLTHLAAGELYSRGLIQVPPFVTLTMAICPVGYAAVRFGLRGSLATAAWLGLLLVPNLLLLDSRLLSWADATILVLVLAIGAVAGRLVDSQGVETKRLVEAARLRGIERVAEQLPDGVCLIDTAGDISYVNPAWASMQGLGSSQDAVGLPLASFHQPESTGHGQLPYERPVPTDGPGRSIVAHQLPDGSQLWAAVASAPMLDEQGRIIGRLSTVRDVTQDHAAAVALQEAEQLFRLTFERAPLGIATVTLDGRFLQVNHVFCQMVGRTAQEILALGVRGLTPLEELTQAEEVLRGRAPAVRVTKHLIHRDGHLVLVEVTLSLMHRPDGKPWYRISHYRDVTEEQQRHEQLLDQAYHDPLTGLPNRLLLEDRLTQALTKAGRRRHQVALLFCDLDDFKTINDRLGHPVGDQVLREVATRLSSSVRNEDTVARFGGDEFVVMLDGVTGPPQATTIASRILEAVRQPTTVSEEQLLVGISIGIAISSGPSSKSEELLRTADSAMYSAKMAGGHGFRLAPSTGAATAATKTAGRRPARARGHRPQVVPSQATE